MDPITHTLTGVALSRAGLSRATPLATATLIIAANVPDIDVAVYAFGNGYDALALRRGWTHGPLAMALLPFLTAGAVLAWDRWVRRARDPSAPPARGRAVLLLALLGVLTHPLLDWMNTYGIRLLMPFEDRWFYGDALFIVDPWIWLGLGAAVFLGRGRGEDGTIAEGRSDEKGSTVARGERRARAVGALVAAYIIAMVVTGTTAERYVRRVANERFEGRVRDVMVGPVPANPFAGQVVVETTDAYHTGSFSWLRTPRLTLDGPRLPTLAPDPVIDAAAENSDVRNYLIWSRFPYAQVDTLPNGYRVRFGDARYPDGRAGSLSGVVVEGIGDRRWALGVGRWALGGRDSGFGHASFFSVSPPPGPVPPPVTPPSPSPRPPRSPRENALHRKTAPPARMPSTTNAALPSHPHRHGSAKARVWPAAGREACPSERTRASSASAPEQATHRIRRAMNPNSPRPERFPP